MILIKYNRMKIVVSVAVTVIIIIILLFKYSKESESYSVINDELEIKSNMQKDLENKNEEVVGVEDLYIHIAGEVKNPGIVIVESGGRIIDVIEAAGGITEKADLTNVNLAYQLEDGQKIYIPYIGELEESIKKEENGIYSNVIIQNGYYGETQSEIKENKVNINSANQTELETLTGIGPSLASKIMEYRNANGKFKSVEEIKNVSGIGDSKYEAVKDSIVVK